MCNGQHSPEISAEDLQTSDVNLDKEMVIFIYSGPYKLIFRIMFLVVYRYRSLPFILQIQINKHYMLLILTNLKRLEYSHTNYFSNV